MTTVLVCCQKRVEGSVCIECYDDGYNSAYPDAARDAIEDGIARAVLLRVRNLMATGEFTLSGALDEVVQDEWERNVAASRVEADMQLVHLDALLAQMDWDE